MNSSVSARAKTQLSLTVAAALAAVDLFYDLDGVLMFVRSQQWSLLGIHVAILLTSGIVEALVLVSVRKNPVRFFLSFLRLNLIPDFYNVFARPSYTTLHPQFAQPVALAIQATVKAIPTLMLQAYLTIGPVFTPTSAERVLSAILTPQLALGCASVAFGLAACEAEDFKHRNILRPVSYASPSFLLLLVYRLVEIASRTLALMYMAATAPLIVGLSYLFHCGIVALVGTPRQSQHTPGAMYSDSKFTRSWQTLILYFVYWDFRISRTSTLVPAAWSTGARLIDYFITLGYLHNVGLLPTAEHATLVWLSLTIATFALTPFVNQLHWSGHAKILQARIELNSQSPRLDTTLSPVKRGPRVLPRPPLDSGCRDRETKTTPVRASRPKPYVDELRKRLTATNRRDSVGVSSPVQTPRKPLIPPKPTSPWSAQLCEREFRQRKPTVPPKTPRAITAGTFCRRSDLTDAGARALNIACRTSEFTASRMVSALSRCRASSESDLCERTDDGHTVWYHSRVLKEAVVDWSTRRRKLIEWESVDRLELPMILKESGTALGAVLNLRPKKEARALLAVRFEAGLEDTHNRYWVYGYGSSPKAYSRSEFDVLLKSCDSPIIISRPLPAGDSLVDSRTP